MTEYTDSINYRPGHGVEERASGTDPGGRRWGYGLAAWILAAYTDPADVVLDLDGDPHILGCAQTMDRACTICPRPGRSRALRGTAHLVTGYWPRDVLDQPYAADGADRDDVLLAEVADVLAPGGRLALVLRVPAPTEPLTLHTGDLLAAAFAAGLGHLVAVHAVALASPVGSDAEGLGPDYRCALVFHRPGRHRRTSTATGPAGGASIGRLLR